MSATFGRSIPKALTRLQPSRNHLPSFPKRTPPSSLLPPTAAPRPFSSASTLRDTDKPDKDKKAVHGAKPKILDEDPPLEKDQAEDVKQHNREMDTRAERAAVSVSVDDAPQDKVPKGFWSDPDKRAEEKPKKTK
ncbi:hypothetical protein P152DRAFT_458008 [Eremomyces bilateralis CBS 781.70]|uniref:Uncharacterized protein n=1 Tax=Eremomyces bilateralis CBS 781.70 TaxID=1392243 RepID=A0A6G1G3Y9_9PEZI|nr:uncharacterized protein P152DRAFT_458008 [Eremomyces bilateralis CBS 781.70]KAF1812815.1 hypothetical protein P152DRAFT_458008 [Eremomyces bilateralis CBS 781.70]